MLEEQMFVLVLVVDIRTGRFTVGMAAARRRHHAQKELEGDTLQTENIIYPVLLTLHILHVKINK